MTESPEETERESPQPDSEQDTGKATLLVLEEIRDLMKGLASRLADLEDATAESFEEIGQMKKTLFEVKKSVAKRKHLKKLQKILDQLEVVDVGAEDSTRPSQS